MVPKTPIKNEPIDLSKQKIFTPERNPITPVKLVDKQQAEPWTPTANLKMLISAASPDIRDREKKKELFRPIENKHDTFTESLQVNMLKTSKELKNCVLILKKCGILIMLVPVETKVVLKLISLFKPEILPYTLFSL